MAKADHHGHEQAGSGENEEPGQRTRSQCSLGRTIDTAPTGMADSGCGKRDPRPGRAC